MTKRKEQETLAIYRNDGIDMLRLRKSTHIIRSPPTLGDGDNGNYSTFEFTSNELSEITYLQLNDNPIGQ